MAGVIVHEALAYFFFSSVSQKVPLPGAASGVCEWKKFDARNNQLFAFDPCTGYHQLIRLGTDIPTINPCVVTIAASRVPTDRMPVIVHPGDWLLRDTVGLQQRNIANPLKK